VKVDDTYYFNFYPPDGSHRCGKRLHIEGNMSGFIIAEKERYKHH